MPDAQIRVELPSDHPHVLLATIDNPPVNVMNTALYLRMQEFFEGIAGDGKVRCIVLTGAGASAFVAGSDVKDFAVLTPGTALARARIIRNAFTAIRECVVPVIGAINGPALGAGMAIAAACDVVLAAENAVFGLPEINVGVLGGAQHLSRMVPPKRMRWMALSGKRLSAQEVTAAGGVERVVPADRLIAEALAMADEIAEKSPPAIHLQKECLNLIETLGVDQGYHVEQLGTAILSSLPESKEAASAFVAKRKPNSTDRSIADPGPRRQRSEKRRRRIFGNPPSVSSMISWVTPGGSLPSRSGFAASPRSMTPRTKASSAARSRPDRVSWGPVPAFLRFAPPPLSGTPASSIRPRIINPSHGRGTRNRIAVGSAGSRSQT